MTCTDKLSNVISQLLLSKRLFLEGRRFLRPSDAVGCGIAISLFQDACEMLVWALVKKFDAPIKDGAPFTANIETLQKHDIRLADVARILELNKARVGYKHYGNLPAFEDAKKHEVSAEVFLRAAFAGHFNCEFDEISSLDIVSFPEVRARLKQADASAKAGDYESAVKECSIAKAIVFGELRGHPPRIPIRLSRGDDILAQKLEQLRPERGYHSRISFDLFRELSDYLEEVGEVMLVSLSKLPMEDYRFLSSTLYKSQQLGDGSWIHSNSYSQVTLSLDVCVRQINCMIEMCIRLKDELPDLQAV